MKKVTEWLLSYFSARAELPPGVESLNYFELGLIDSFGVIELIDEMEREFDFQFEQSHFQDRRFSTINGLTEIVSEIKSEIA